MQEPPDHGLIRKLPQRHGHNYQSITTMMTHATAPLDRHTPSQPSPNEIETLFTFFLFFEPKIKKQHSSSLKNFICMVPGSYTYVGTMHL
jgi:hypothetical protein